MSKGFYSRLCLQLCQPLFNVLVLLDRGVKVCKYLCHYAVLLAPCAVVTLQELGHAVTVDDSVLEDCNGAIWH